MAMIFLGVPIFDWVILVVLIGFGIEAYVTTRTPKDKSKSSLDDSAKSQGGTLNSNHKPPPNERD